VLFVQTKSKGLKYEICRRICSRASSARQPISSESSRRAATEQQPLIPSPFPSGLLIFGTTPPICSQQPTYRHKHSLHIDTFSTTTRNLTSVSACVPCQDQVSVALRATESEHDNTMVLGTDTVDELGRASAAEMAPLIGDVVIGPLKCKKVPRLKP
jgi:hypothetical protein